MKVNVTVAAISAHISKEDQCVAVHRNHQWAEEYIGAEMVAVDLPHINSKTTILIQDSQRIR